MRSPAPATSTDSVDTGAKGRGSSRFVTPAEVMPTEETQPTEGSDPTVVEEKKENEAEPTPGTDSGDASNGGSESAPLEWSSDRQLRPTGGEADREVATTEEEKQKERRKP